MELYTYKGISSGKYIEGEIEAINQEEASHKLKEQKIIITNCIVHKKGIILRNFHYLKQKNHRLVFMNYLRRIP